LSSSATPAAPAFSLERSRQLAADDVATATASTFPELVWAHFLHQKEIHKNGELHGPAEEEYHQKLCEFVEEQGKILNAYWCTSEASAVALTEKRGDRVLGFLWRRQPNIRFHAATDWATKDAPNIGHSLHTCETLGIRVTEVLGGSGERIAMQWILSVSGYLLGVVDRHKGNPPPAEEGKAVRRARAELAQVEAYYDRAGEKTGRLIYFWGMMLGFVALGVLAVIGSLVYSLFGGFHLKDQDTQLFFICYAMGGIGAVVSVMNRMTAGGNFTIDYEVGRPALRRVGSFRPVLGAIFAVVLYFMLESGLISIKAGDGDRTGFFYGALAFVAGFSERRAKIITGGAEKFLGGGGAEDEAGAREREQHAQSEPAAGSTG
jgi:hypothetical protein